MVAEFCDGNNNNFVGYLFPNQIKTKSGYNSNVGKTTCVETETNIETSNFAKLRSDRKCAFVSSKCNSFSFSTNARLHFNKQPSCAMIFDWCFDSLVRHVIARYLCVCFRS